MTHTEQKLHEPVMLDEIVGLVGEMNSLDLCFVDGTVGQAGHSLAIARQLKPAVHVCFDRDSFAVQYAKQTLEPYGAVVIAASYVEAVRAIQRAFRLGQQVAVLLDLGLGTHQFEQSGRGFSYKKVEEPLDLRFDDSTGQSAAMWLHTAGEKTIAKALKQYGELRKAYAIARSMTNLGPSASVGDLLSALPAPARSPKTLAQIFQALRIVVNEELAQLEMFFDQLEDVLRRESGRLRLLIISFHSLEDRLVKQRFADWARDCECPPKTPVCICGATPLGRVYSRKPMVPSQDECQRNPRARSAKLRVFDVGMPEAA